MPETPEDLRTVRCGSRNTWILTGVLVGVVAVGVLLPAGIWFWTSMADLGERSRAASAHEEAGDRAFETGEYLRAMTAYTYARDMRPTASIQQKFIRARLYLGSVRPDLLGQWNREDVEYQRAFLLARDPRAKAVAETLAGHLARLIGNADEAKERYKAALAADAECAGAHLGLGLLAYRTGKTDDAKSELEAFVKKFPDHREAILALADIRLNAGDADGAIEMLNRILKTRNDPEAHHGLGLAYQRKNQLRDAAAQFQMAIQLNPNARESHLALGNLYLDAELYPMAEQAFRAALNLAQDENALTGLARSLNGQKRFADALQALSGVLSRGNAGPFAMLAAAEASEGLGRRDDAARLYEETLKFLEKLQGRVDPKALSSLQRQVQAGLDRLKAPASTPPKP